MGSKNSDQPTHDGAEQTTAESTDVLRVLRTREETKAFYNKISKVYDLLAESSEAPMRDAGIELLQPASGETLLEIGFGTGHCLVELARAVGPRGKVYGIDLAENMRAVAEESVTKAGVSDRVELACGDALRLPYGDASIDGVFMSFTLELFDTPEIPGVLAECQRVLRPGGRMVVVAVSKEGKQNFVVHAFEWTHKHFPNLVDCRPIHVRRALEAAGFEVRDWRLEHMWVPVEIVRAIRRSGGGRTSV